jgi:hypothetical protein
MNAQVRRHLRRCLYSPSFAVGHQPSRDSMASSAARLLPGRLAIRGAPCPGLTATRLSAAGGPRQLEGRQDVGCGMAAAPGATLTDCLVGKPRRRRGRRVRHSRRAGSRARATRPRSSPPMAHLATAMLVLLGVVTSFAPNGLQQRWSSRGQNVSNIDDAATQEIVPDVPLLHEPCLCRCAQCNATINWHAPSLQSGATSLFRGRARRVDRSVPGALRGVASERSLSAKEGGAL